MIMLPPVAVEPDPADGEGAEVVATGPAAAEVATGAPLETVIMVVTVIIEVTLVMAVGAAPWALEGSVIGVKLVPTESVAVAAPPTRAG